MKKKLLLIWVPSVLIIAVAWFVFFNMKNGDSNKNNIVNVEQEKEIQPYHRTVDEYEERKYLSREKCYDASWNLMESPEYDAYGNFINCYNSEGERNWVWVWYYENWQIYAEWNFKDWVQEDGKWVE